MVSANVFCRWEAPRGKDGAPFFLYDPSPRLEVVIRLSVCATRWLPQVPLPSSFYLGLACGVGQRSGVAGMEEEITVN